LEDSKLSGTFDMEYFIENFRHATPEEIEKHLIAEAYRLYPIGTWFISQDDQNRKRQVKPYDKNKDVTWYVSKDFSEVRCSNGMFNTGLPLCSNPLVYKNGKWAKIVSSHPEIKVNGYTAEFHEWGIKIGCKKIYKESIEVWNNALSTLELEIGKPISVLWKEGEIKSSQIKQIAEHFSKSK
jgi:hypothetical protein